MTSVWDDSWGACDARGVRGDRGTKQDATLKDDRPEESE